jgi:hypothetical protein
MKKILILSLLFICFLFIDQKAEAKIWTKDLVDKVTLNSGYKLSLCTIDLKNDHISQADNIFGNQENAFEASPSAYPCNNQSQEDMLFANITLYFSKVNWGGGNVPDKLIEFQNHLYSLVGYGDILSDINGKDPYGDTTPLDWFSTLPGIHGIWDRGLMNTDPNAPAGQAELPDSNFLIIHDPTTGKFVSALFFINNLMYKVSSIISQVSVPTTLVDYTATPSGQITPTPISTMSSQLTPTPAPDMTADWKTYISDDNKFSIKYPSNWYLNKTNMCPLSCIDISDVSNSLDMSFYTSHKGHTSVAVNENNGVMLTNFPYLQTVQNDLQKISNPNPTIKKFSINSYTGIRGETSDPSMGIGEAVYLSNPKGGWVSIIKFVDDNRIFDQILSTFRFTN